MLEIALYLHEFKVDSSYQYIVGKRKSSFTIDGIIRKFYRKGKELFQVTRDVTYFFDEGVREA